MKLLNRTLLTLVPATCRINWTALTMTVVMATTLTIGW